MPATITLNLDDKTAKGFAGLIENAGNAEAELKELVKSLQSVESETKKVGAASQQWGNVAQKVTAVSTGVLAGVELFKKFSEAGKKAIEMVNRLAEEGNPAAISLSESFQEVQDALGEIARDPLVQDAFQGLADIIRDDLIPAMKSVPDAWRGTQSFIAASITDMTDFIGLTEGASSELQAMNQQQERSIALRKQQAEEQKKQFEAQKALQKVEQDLATFDQQRAMRAEQERLSQISDAKQLEELKRREAETLKTLATEGKLTDDLRKKSLTEIALIEERLVALKKEQIDADKKQEEARKKFADALKKSFETAANAARDAMEKAAEAARKNVEALLAKEKKMVDDLASKIIAMRKQLTPGGPEQDLLQSIRGKLDPRATLRQIAEDRARKAVQQVAGAGGDEREQRRAAVKARETAFRQARAGGRFNDAEVATAQKELTQGVIDGAVQSGKLSETQAKALRQAAETVGQVAENQAQMQENIEQIERVMQEQLNLANQVNRRQRAQRSGG